jgi:TolA-binding protein
VRRRLAFATLLLVGLAAGCAAGNKRDPRADFDEGYAAFEAGKWQAASDGFTRYLGSGPPAPLRGEVHYYRGLSEVHIQQRAEAKADFLKALALDPKEPIRHFAQVALGNIYFEEGDDANAVATYGPVVRAAPTDVPLDRVILRLSISLQRIGKWSVAGAYLAYLVHNYPGTPASEEGQRRMNATAFVVQVGAFSSAAAANTEAARLRRAGFVPRVVPMTSKGSQSLVAVQVGSCQTYAEAAALVARVHKAGFATVIVP